MRIKIPVAIVGLVLTLAACNEQVVEPENGSRASLSDTYATAGADAAAVQRNFTAPLTGKEEVPPVETQGTGVAKFKLSKDGTSIDYKLNVSNLEGITQAHIHCGAEGVAGPPVVFLFGFIAEGVTVHGTLAEGTITADDVIPRPDSPECPGGLADFEELLEKIEAGETYVNVHTLAKPGGEIRGQI